MKITDLKCAVIGDNPIVRIVTDEGISGYGEVESYKPYLVPIVMMLKPALIGEDPTNVERVMRKIRSRGGFKPWGAAVSAVEMALWDLAGKAAGVPVYKLLGGKVRDRVRAYNGALRSPMTGQNPEDYAANVAIMKDLPETFSIVKQAIAFHTPMYAEVPNFFYGEPQTRAFHSHINRRLMTEKGLKHVVACVEAMKDVLGDEVGLALDCGPGWMLPDAIRFAKAVEHLNILWLEDLLTGDYIHWVNGDVYRELTRSSTTPIHTVKPIVTHDGFSAGTWASEVDKMRSVYGADISDADAVKIVTYLQTYYSGEPASASAMLVYGSNAPGATPGASPASSPVASPAVLPSD